MNGNIRIGALISGGGTNLQAIIDACESGKIHGDLVFVGTDNPNAQGLERSKTRGIPSFSVDYSELTVRHAKAPDTLSPPKDFLLKQVLQKQHLFPSDSDPHKTASFFKIRAIAESMLLEKMKPYPFDLLVLAGFMRTLTPYFIDKINTDPNRPRIMNIHPALLPAFAGTDGYGDTFRYGCKIGGCTVHFIDYGEDSGPIIGQRAFPIEEDDTIDTVKKKGLQLEWALYPECIELFAQNRLRVVRTVHVKGRGRRVQRTIIKILPAP
jgi:phosphoribosylglycinamide formyltransferase 1